MTERVVIADIETNGLKDTVTTVHCLSLRIIENGVKSPVYRYLNHEMDDALAVLSSADVVVFHNGIDFDLIVLEMLYPDWQLPETVKVEDTLVLARVVFSNIKDSDFRKYEKGELDGGNIGLHTLEAWGQRTGTMKGDYKKIMEAEAKEKGLTEDADISRYVWGEYNPRMGDYCDQDIEVTTHLWEMIRGQRLSPLAQRLEQRIHHIMCLQEEFGFQFDAEKAVELREEVSVEHERLTAEAISHFGTWIAPKKLWKGIPRPEFGEDATRKHWGEVECPTKTLNYKQVPVDVWFENGEVKTSGPMPKAIRTEGAAFCPVKIVDFNPNSRPQIIDRLTKIHQWEPTEFTEKKNPKVDDDVLRNLAQFVPICETLAELFFLSKLLGQLDTGKNAWLAMVKDDGRIHGRVNVGGTVTGRGSHSRPNIAQIPKVLVVSVRTKEGDYNPKVLDKNGEPYPWVFKADGTEKAKTILFGRAGKFGFECRSLFTAPPGWWLMGCDLSGVELRCLAARLSEFDGGEYVKEVLNGDPHTKNMLAFELNSRDTAKTCLYAIMYGGGDEKIGSIVCDPSSSVGHMKSRGKQLKSNLQRGIPAFGHLMKKIAKDAKRGYMDGLDGRRLFVRSSHAALNVQLQSDGALLAKLWVVYFYDLMEEAGYIHGVDWGMCAWVHDEIQAACRTEEIAIHAQELCEQAAVMAGEFFDYKSPIAAQAQRGRTWADTH